jgi:hypothetical protein
MSKHVFAALLLLICNANLWAQDTKAAPPKEFMQITTVESVVGGGMGRSKMIITNADGSQTETELNNLFSIAGINFSNIKENENKVLATLKKFSEAGWKVEQVVPLSLSPSNNSMGIFMTRYLLTKDAAKKSM